MTGTSSRRPTGHISAQTSYSPDPIEDLSHVKGKSRDEIPHRYFGKSDQRLGNVVGALSISKILWELSVGKISVP